MFTTISSGILIAGDYLDGKCLINGVIILPLFVSILQDAILFITIWNGQEIYEDKYTEQCKIFIIFGNLNVTVNWVLLHY